MKDLKIFIVIAIIVGITYWGIEPLAHGIMHKHIEEAIEKYHLPDYNFSDLGPTPPLDGNAEQGKQNFQMFCASCHGLKADGIKAPMDPKTAAASFGVVPPDLSNVASFTDEKFLFHFIKDPAKASEFKKIAMPAMGLNDEQIADIIAYLKSTAKKLEGKELVKEACGRCHSIKYQKVYAETPPENLKKYLGKVPPDLSIIMKAKGEEYIAAFINKPQALLPGTSMPRVGLNKEATEETLKYLEEIADPHKEQRQKVGIIVLAYMLVMIGLTYAWKKKIWKNLH
ncbi:c-type cytochrome [Persephonella sp. IF05-L8]|uniref:c-type cytochrome n=1 Tax=Persephonella sp. IF05-L8 TaxID=1158338 RepID=UPI0004957C50